MVEPLGCWVPAAGPIFETTNADGATSAIPLYFSLKPASLSAFLATSHVLPTTSGTVTGSGPFDVSSSSVSPGRTGSCWGCAEMTSPSATVSLKLSGPAEVRRPTLLSAAEASSTDLPATSGMAPTDTTRLTAAASK